MIEQNKVYFLLGKLTTKMEQLTKSEIFSDQSVNFKQSSQQKIILES
jgi:hypothetical protein